MKERIITAICLMLVAVPCVIFGGYYFKGLIGVILAWQCMRCYIYALVQK